MRLVDEDISGTVSDIQFAILHTKYARSNHKVLQNACVQISNLFHTDVAQNETADELLQSKERCNLVKK